MFPDPDARLAFAMEHRRFGRLNEAEQVYIAVLADRPNDPQALLGLGVISLRRGHFDTAVPQLAAVANVPGASDEAWWMYVRALVMAGQFEHAERLMHARSRPPADVELLLGQRWGFTLIANGRSDLAEIQFQRATELNPGVANVHTDLAQAQLLRGKHGKAEQTLVRALALDPNHTDARVNLGTALRGLDRGPEAEAAYRAALAIHPNQAGAQRNLGALLNLSERHAEALALADQWRDEGQSDAVTATRGAALQGLGRYEEAASCFAHAAAVADDPYDSLVGQGIAQAALGNYVDALAVLEQAVKTRPNASAARYHRGLVRLMTGSFREGWSDYEARWQEEFSLVNGRDPARALKDRFDVPLSSDCLVGQRVLLVGEQGIGDQVMFASMIPDLARIAREIVCVCNPRLVKLFSGSMPNVTFSPASDREISLAGFDKVLAMGSLGRLFRTESFHFDGMPFLRARPETLARWAERLGPSRRRIGLSWRGGTAGTRRGLRSVALRDMAPLFSTIDAEFVCLQYGDAQEEVRIARDELGAEITPIDPADSNDFEDLAGLIRNLDAVISVQNTNVHLAGALGTPCLALIPSLPEWRYLAEGPTMPWYRSVRMFRQTERSAWGPVVESVTAALRIDLRP